MGLVSRMGASSFCLAFVPGFLYNCDKRKRFYMFPLPAACRLGIMLSVKAGYRISPAATDGFTFYLGGLL